MQPDHWPTVEEMLGAPVHQLMVGYDPRTYPFDPRLAGKVKRKPPTPESVPLDCKAEWERIRAEHPWPHELGYSTWEAPRPAGSTPCSRRPGCSNEPRATDVPGI